MINDVTRSSAPLAIEPFYSCAKTNQPIVLFRGRVDLVTSAGTSRHRGGIVLEWLPSPTLRTWVRGAASELGTETDFDADDVAVTPRTPPRTVPQQSKTTRGGPRKATTTFEISPQLSNYECGDTTAGLTHGLLHVANFPRLYGRPVSWPDGSVGSRRLLFQGGGWKITLDPVPNGKDLEENLKGNGGFALTHTARVERVSGVRFTTTELQDLTEAFTWFCWLCTEARCGPMLPVGFDHDRAVWARWSPTRTESFHTDRRWLDSRHGGEAEALFPSFMARFQDAYWRQVLKHAIDYLVEAGHRHPINRAIVMAQVLLEGMSYSWLVVERRLRTHDEFEDRKAAQNIRQMLLDMKIPVAIPDNLTALAATRSTRGTAVDGPQAFVLKRNEIIHRRGATPAPSPAPFIDAWRLGAWYSELAVLHLCGFNGQYHNRLSDDDWAGAVEDVPWK